MHRRASSARWRWRCGWRAHRLVTDKAGSAPVLVLDDVLSELDPAPLRGAAATPATRPGRADDGRSAAGSRPSRRDFAHRSWHGDVVSRDPVPIGDSLDTVVRSLRNDVARTSASSRPDASQMGGVFGRWAEAVGDAVAAHVKPVKLDGTKLVVEVDDPAWATQLRFLETDLEAAFARSRRRHDRDGRGPSQDVVV